jgi:transmembrane sensor
VVRSKQHSERDRLIASEASAWSESLPTANAAQRRRFARWLARSPAHLREFLLCHFVDDALSRFDPERQVVITSRKSDSNVVPLSEHLPPGANWRKRSRTSWRRPALAFAAAAVLAVGITLMYFGSSPTVERYQTGIGEQLTVALADGSLIALNAKTSLEVDFGPTARNLHLFKGQAMFTVAHDVHRPFNVRVNSATVKAVGTKFDVRRAGDEAVVSVIEGRVQIEQRHSASTPVSTKPVPMAVTKLERGQGATVRQDGEITPPADVNLIAATAWQERRLIFEDRRLADIADEFAAYVRSPRLVVEGTELSGRLYTGSFDADRPDSFIDYLQRDASIEIVRSEDRVIIRQAMLH